MKTIYSPMDLHMHSENSWDATVSMADMCQAALDKNIPEIAFTEHFDNFTEDKSRASYDPVTFFSDIEANRAKFARKGLTIRAGVEVGEYHLYDVVVDPIIEKFPYDVVLGSLHWLRGEVSVFQPSTYKGKTFREAIKPYFTELLELIDHGKFDILAHMDVFKRRAFIVYGDYKTEDWETEIRNVWQACIEKGIGVEINTGGMRWSIDSPHPDLTALKWYKEMGGEILTVSSDAHNTRDLGFGLDYALSIAAEAGFKALARYEKRQVIDFVPFDVKEGNL